MEEERDAVGAAERPLKDMPPKEVRGWLVQRAMVGSKAARRVTEDVVAAPWKIDDELVVLLENERDE